MSRAYQITEIVMNVSHHWGSTEHTDTSASAEGSLFKIQHEDENGIWTDVLDAAGLLRTFATTEMAWSCIETEFRMDTYLAKYGDRQHARVIRIFRNDKVWREG
tara:strand:+ start:1949 stop:2260 length:312 start_codon:yes stop_codon:yes gene_type:complete